MTPPAPELVTPEIRTLGMVDYAETWRAMQDFTNQRGPDTPDELWVLEHPPVYTVGLSGRDQHLPRIDPKATMRDAHFDPASIPVMRVDRGGQITYHGPGQAVVYTLVDLNRRGLKVREMVGLLEEGVIAFLAERGVHGHRKEGAPGVYIHRLGKSEAKIAALGLKIRKGCSFHGVSLNVDVDLDPFLAIDPCGYPGLAVTRAADLGIPGTAAEIGLMLAKHIGAKIAVQPDRSGPKMQGFFHGIRPES